MQCMTVGELVWESDHESEVLHPFTVSNEARQEGMFSSVHVYFLFALNF